MVPRLFPSIERLWGTVITSLFFRWYGTDIQRGLWWLTVWKSNQISSSIFGFCFVLFLLYVSVCIKYKHRWRKISIQILSFDFLFLCLISILTDFLTGCLTKLTMLTLLSCYVDCFWGEQCVDRTDTWGPDSGPSCLRVLLKWKYFISEQFPSLILRPGF